MNKYERLKTDLVEKGTGSMKCFGNSMKPILPNPSICTYQPRDEYAVGDIVFCRVHGRYIDAHQITKKKVEGGTIQYLISNNHGWDNGWTAQIFGKVVSATDKDGTVKYQSH